MSSAAENNRAATLGNLIRNGRQHAGRSVADCATILNLAEEEYKQIERGQFPVSLPHLEALAMYFGLPMGYFWGSEQLEQTRRLDYQNFVTLRQRVVGVTVKQYRKREQRSMQDLAVLLDLAESEVKAIEAGTRPISYLELEKVSNYLNVPIVDFVEDGFGPLGRHEAEYRLQKQFHDLSPEMQDFVSDPRNISYLETARRLSSLDVESLRRLAETILDITY